MPMKPLAQSIIAALSLVVALVAPLSAVTPAEWVHSTEADFAAGEFDGTVVSSLGQLRLGRQTDIVFPVDEAPAVVFALSAAGETLYAGSGVDGVVWRIEDGKAAEFATVPGSMVACLVTVDDGVLVGTGGEEAGAYHVGKDGAVRKLWSTEGVEYVWALVRQGDLTYAATGPKGAVYEIQANGKARTIYEAGDLAKNILCLVPDGTDRRLLLAGTDVSGLVVEIDPKRRTSRVLLDADESEISALVPDGKGGVYAATSDASLVAEDGDPEPAQQNAGRSAATATTAPAAKESEEAEDEGDEDGGPAPEEDAEDNGAKADGAKDDAAKADDVEADDAEDAPADEDEADAAADTDAEDSASGGLNGPIIQVLRKPLTGTPGRGGADGGAGGDAAGNAVYHIGSDGMVRTLFRRGVMIFALLRQDNRLLLGTGNGGDVYAVSLDGDEIARVVRTEARQIAALAPRPDGSVAFGTANRGAVGILRNAPAEKGAFTSSALDAAQRAAWGTLRVAASVPPGAKVTVATRSGNVAKPDDATWSSWSAETPVTRDFRPIASPAGRFLQYRLTLAAKDGASPVVTDVGIIYQVGNLAPTVQALGIVPSAVPANGGAPDAEGPLAWRVVRFQGADQNEDALVYALDLREVGEDTWVRIAKDLEQPQYSWDTRTVSDGIYELRVVASDRPANPPQTALTGGRISEPLTVDNSPPVLSKLTVKLDGGKATVSGTVSDATSRVTTIHYAVDSQTEWVTVLPADGIADSNRESFTFTTDALPKGAHRLAVRVSDAFGNLGYATATVKVE